MLAGRHILLDKGKTSHAIEVYTARLEHNVRGLSHFAVHKSAEPDAAACLIHFCANCDLEVVAICRGDSRAKSRHNIPHIETSPTRRCFGGATALRLLPVLTNWDTGFTSEAGLDRAFDLERGPDLCRAESLADVADFVRLVAIGGPLSRSRWEARHQREMIAHYGADFKARLRRQRV